MKNCSMGPHPCTWYNAAYQGTTMARMMSAPGTSMRRPTSGHRRCSVIQITQVSTGNAMATGPLVNTPRPIATYMASSHVRRWAGYRSAIAKHARVNAMKNEIQMSMTMRRENITIRGAVATNRAAISPVSRDRRASPSRNAEAMMPIAPAAMPTRSTATETPNTL
jgi:hypothetical protein